MLYFPSDAQYREFKPMDDATDQIPPILYLEGFRLLTSHFSGLVDSLWPFVFGRFMSGIGGAGMTDLLFVLINGWFLLIILNEQ